jgi:transposase
MGRFVEEADRGQWMLLPECLDDFIDESNPVRVIDPAARPDISKVFRHGQDPNRTI